ncbi:hypothetical protein CY34DRAFT_100883, partial [Suillus luteus UH-Slu-Lm8-n1]
TARQWDLKADKEVEEVRDVCEEYVWAVAVSRDGRWVVTGGGYWNMRIWKLETGKLVAGPFESDNWVCAVRLSTDSKKLAVKPKSSHQYM